MKLVEDNTALWLETVPRSIHNGFTLFPFGITDTGELHSYEIDPNQNLNVATLFSYLYWEKNSVYYKNELFKDIVFNEVNAVLSLQKENGSLPLREYRYAVEDSNYGGYCGTMLYHLAQMWGVDEWIKATVAIGNWLNTDFSEAHPWNVPEDGVNFATERYYPYNLIARILPFYAAGLSKSEIFNWIDYIKTAFPDDELDMETRWYFSQSMPRDFLTDVKIKNELKPFVFSDFSDQNKLSVRAIGEEISMIKISVCNSNNAEVWQCLLQDKISDFFKTSSLKKGTYLYSVTCMGNTGKTSVYEDEFVLDSDADIDFKVTCFDRNNRFGDKL